jgi:Short C-terminal domain
MLCVMRILRLVAVVSLATVGCLSIGGGSDTTTVNQPTIGEQLLDLKKAYDAGTLSKEEYETMREAILRGEK